MNNDIYLFAKITIEVIIKLPNCFFDNLTFKRALSSVGSEHLVYTQRVGGSNPSAPTFLTSWL